MKKWLPYILGLLGFILLAVLVVTGGTAKRTRKLDERITLKQTDKIPYGVSAAKDLLPTLFPDASVYSDNKGPGLWDEISVSGTNQAVILTATPRMNVDEYEMDRLLSFVEKGNYVFIISKSFSDEAQRTFGFSYAQSGFEEIFGGVSAKDSLAVKLEKPSFRSDELFVYPGLSYESSFTDVDTSRTTILGRNAEGRPNFIRLSRDCGIVGRMGRLLTTRMAAG